MEKASRVSNGAIELPVGFRFHPTDEEFVVHYLRRRVFSLPLPTCSIIPDHFDVFHTNPWELPGDMREKRYFFSKREGNKNRSYSSISTGSGYWKAIGKEKKIMATESNKVIGIKKLLVFHQGKWPHGSRTGWVMYEYRLVGWWTTPRSKQRLLGEKQDWVACCIALKKTKDKTHGVGAQYSFRNRSGKMEMIMPISMDFTMEGNTGIVPPQTSQSCSESGITEVSCDESNQEENSTCDSCNKKQ